jgi:hypothetical protein
MGLKSIFQEGMKERKRKRSLGKVSNEFKDKEKVHAVQLTVLGQKAWEAKADISAFADLQTTLGAAQNNLDDLRAQSEKLQTQKQENETAKKQESDRFTASQKEAAEKKRDVDRRLNEQKNAWQTLQKEVGQATSRLAAIAVERTRLNGRFADPALPEAEKSEASEKLAALAKEEDELKALVKEKEEPGKTLPLQIAPLQEESDTLQKQIESIRGEQKKMLAEMDKKISALGNNLSKNKEKIREGEAKQKLDFKILGERLAAAHQVDPNIAGEMAAVLTARTEMEGVQALIGGLERQKDGSQVSAYKKMMAIIIGAIALVVAIIVLLFILLAPGKKETSLSSLFEREGKAAKSMEELAQQMQKGMGGIKAESEKIQGQKIIIASQSALGSTLPVVGGWQPQPPRYRQGAFGDLETATLQAEYAAADGGSVHVQVTDAGTASALLAPLKMIFALNMRIDDQDVVQRVSTYNGIPVAERFDKKDKEATLGIIFKDRYLIELKTKAARGLELLKEFAAKLDFSKLQQ